MLFYPKLSNMKPIKLLIADDHPVIISGLRMVLDQEESIDLYGEVHDGEELIKLLETDHVDVILLDINMPIINGIDACKIIAEKHPDIRILAFSQYIEKRFVQRLLKNGAHGYLLKSSSAREIVSAIQLVHQGGFYLSSELPNIFSEANKPKSNKLFPDLSNRELDVLKLICNELNTQEIADTLFISKHTVESHRANLLLKVGVKNTAGLVKWAIENEIIQ